MNSEIAFLKAPVDEDLDGNEVTEPFPLKSHDLEAASNGPHLKSSTRSSSQIYWLIQ